MRGSSVCGGRTPRLRKSFRRFGRFLRDAWSSLPRLLADRCDRVPRRIPERVATVERSHCVCPAGRQPEQHSAPGVHDATDKLILRHLHNSALPLFSLIDGHHFGSCVFVRSGRRRCGYWNCPARSAWLPIPADGSRRWPSRPRLPPLVISAPGSRSSRRHFGYSGRSRCGGRNGSRRLASPASSAGSSPHKE